MAKLKLLKSIGHNTVHSFLSLMNYRENDVVVGHLHTIAQDTGLERIHIDILGRSIEPNAFEIPVIKQAMNELGRDFERHLKRENISLEDVRSATVSIVFNLQNPRIGVSGEEFERYDCIVRITDKNEKLHEITVKEWWH